MSIKDNKPIQVAYVLTSNGKDIYADMNLISLRIYAGEMTFWPMAGCYKGEGQKKLGKYLDFDRTIFKPIILPELEKSRSRFSLYPEV